jgi:hypothetical protein
MQPIVSNMAALAVAMLFYVWRAHQQVRLQRQRKLCDRVAFMLWVVAEQVTNCDSGLSAVCRG